jgi:hypothetical protein
MWTSWLVSTQHLPKYDCERGHAIAAATKPIAAKFPGGPRPSVESVKRVTLGPHRHDQELINEGREGFLRLMQRS